MDAGLERPATVTTDEPEKPSTSGRELSYKQVGRETAEGTSLLPRTLTALCASSMRARPR